jgi:hypothetical protein
MTGTDFIGWTIRDRITGFTGVCTGFCCYISGCAQLLVTPAIKECGDWQEPRWFDEQRVVLVDGVDRMGLDNSATPGPDAPAPVR